MIAINMEMPKSCDDCPISIYDFEDCEWCGLIDEEVTYLYKNRHPNCPLIEVKEE